MRLFTVAEIRNPTLLSTPKTLHHLFNYRSDGRMPAVEHSRIRIALEHLPMCSSNLICLGRIMKPVQPDYVVFGFAQVLQGIPSSFGENRHWHRLQALFFY